MTTTMNTAIVTAVDHKGCTLAVNGRNTHIAWDLLHDAAEQYRVHGGDETTRELAKFYRGVEDQAWKMVERNRLLPIAFRVHQDSTHVWWVATFRDVAGCGRWIPRAADHGGTHPNATLAMMEAEDRADMLRKQGYKVQEA